MVNSFSVDSMPVASVVQSDEKTEGGREGGSVCSAMCVVKIKRCVDIGVRNVKVGEGSQKPWGGRTDEGWGGG